MKGLLLTTITFLPLIGAMLLLFFREENKQQIRILTLFILGVDFVLSLLLWFGYVPPAKLHSIRGGMLYLVQMDWIKTLGVHYYMGVDGLSLLLVMLTTFLGPLVVLAAWDSVQERVKGFCFALLVLQTGMLGAFMALDLFLFYIFWEVMLIPMYFLIGIWGGKRRIYAAVKLLLYTMFGSLLMLVAILYIGIQHETFDLLKLYETVTFTQKEQFWLFLCFGLAFMIKVPLFPFHTWLPDAHVEAPTTGSVILAGVLLKMGTYGLVRFAMPLFPQALMQFTQPLMVLAVIGILYGALVAMVQPDIKKLVAYSSVSHLGFVVLGLLALNTPGLQGGILQMVNHGLSTGALFLLVGMLYDRRHTRLIEDYGGLAKVIPVFSIFFMIVTLSSIGLPGLNGFVGEFLILVGTFSVDKVYAKTYAIVAGSGIILSAVYMLWMFRRVMFGPVTRPENEQIKDLNRREIGILLAMMLFIVWIGVAPRTFLQKTDASVQAFLRHMQKVQGRASTDAKHKVAHAKRKQSKKFVSASR
ncbi:MAG: NADH-quinone oxidoreductase subunit M [Myxococcales bacterium]|nr:NADH-quinone oxidoreductase subunit M [Myxococcales bacterium]